VICATLAKAVAACALEDAAGARSALTEYDRMVERRVESDFALRLPLAVRTALQIGDLALAQTLIAHVSPSLPLYRHALSSAEALLDEGHGEHCAGASGFSDAARRWHDFGVPYEEAQALLGQERCLVALGRASVAAAPLAAARRIFARLGARPALEETEELMRRSPSA
jgi:hypothetical protein